MKMRFIGIITVCGFIFGCGLNSPTHTFDYTTTEKEILSAVEVGISRQDIESQYGSPTLTHDRPGYTMVDYIFDSPPYTHRGKFMGGFSIIYKDGKSWKVSVIYGSK
jgi:outer membrane protein assembly factor BamE (lipoprotein component of BamABCDE complex)